MEYCSGVNSLLGNCIGAGNGTRFQDLVGSNRHPTTVLPYIDARATKRDLGRLERKRSCESREGATGGKAFVAEKTASFLKIFFITCNQSIYPSCTDLDRTA